MPKGFLSAPLQPPKKPESESEEESSDDDEPRPEDGLPRGLWFIYRCPVHVEQRFAWDISTPSYEWDYLRSRQPKVGPNLNTSGPTYRQLLCIIHIPGVLDTVDGSSVCFGSSLSCVRGHALADEPRIRSRRVERCQADAARLSPHPKGPCWYMVCLGLKGVAVS